MTDFTKALSAQTTTITSAEGSMYNEADQRAHRVRWAARVLGTAQTDPRRTELTATKAIRDASGGFLSVREARDLARAVGRHLGPIEPLGLFMVKRCGAIWPGMVATVLVAATTAVEARQLASKQEDQDGPFGSGHWLTPMGSTTQRIGTALDATEPTVMLVEVAS